MKCPYCRLTNTEIFNSRSTKFGNQTWRRRRCVACRQTFTTYEIIDLSFILVEKKNLSTEAFSRTKLIMSLSKALSSDLGASKLSTVEALAQTVEAALLDHDATKIQSSVIAEAVLRTLKHFDVGAFVRFLSHQVNATTSSELQRQIRKF